MSLNRKIIYACENFDNCENEVVSDDLDEYLVRSKEIADQADEHKDQVNEVIEVIDALENYIELFDEAKSNGNMSNLVARTAQIGIEALVSRYDIGKDEIKIALENYGDKAHVYHSTVIAMEDMKDMISKINDKANELITKVKKSLNNMMSNLRGGFGLYIKKAKELKNKIINKQFEEKDIPSDSLKSLFVDNEINPNEVLKKTDKFASGYLSRAEWANPYRDRIEEIVNILKSIPIDKKISDIDVLKKELDQAVEKIKNLNDKPLNVSNSDTEFMFSDVIGFNAKITKTWSSDQELQFTKINNFNKNFPEFVKSLSKEEAIEILDKMISQAEFLENFQWEKITTALDEVSILDSTVLDAQSRGKLFTVEMIRNAFLVMVFTGTILSFPYLIAILSEYIAASGAISVLEALSMWSLATVGTSVAFAMNPIVLIINAFYSDDKISQKPTERFITGQREYKKCFEWKCQALHSLWSTVTSCYYDVFSSVIKYVELSAE